MSWVTEWSALSNRIQGLIEATHLLFLTIRDTKTENPEVFYYVLKPHSEEIHKAIQSYLDTYRSSISRAGTDSIQRFNEAWDKRLRNSDWNQLHHVQLAITLLASFRSEFNFHLSDVQAISRRLTERAFIHLQRSIVADSAIREKWKRAYGSGETECEKLGANHLLSHGIWAFKTMQINFLRTHASI